ncbi:alpha-tocopherol transfer protein-like [Daktulosphaira vitifoliae]|uniref:alpha-tocopherol transfer protein-like n=1 Tax=Daktulosphaira vitifoliae TaxID=58002 RepID=UPI0021AA03EE|nr:alpha-tocopherol transfer protein-like [Daktulosphaira vitifoliae]
MLLQTPNEVQLENLKKEEFYQPPEHVEEDVTQLIEWLSKQPHLPNVTDRQWLTNFIVGCKYNLQKAKKVIESYFVVRSELPKYFGSVSEEELKEITKTGYISLFPKLTPNGDRIFCIRTQPTFNDVNFNVQLALKSGLSILDLQLKEEPLSRNVFIFDLEYFQLSHFLSFTPQLAKHFIHCTVGSFPLRIEKVHFVNPPKFIGRLLNFIKLFLPTKIFERLIAHETFDTLHDYIPKDVLPECYGGTGGSIEKIEESWIEFILQNKEWLDKRPKADLSKCPVNVKTDDLGINGTFKQLTFD